MDKLSTFLTSDLFLLIVLAIAYIAGLTGSVFITDEVERNNFKKKAKISLIVLTVIAFAFILYRKFKG